MKIAAFVLLVVSHVALSAKPNYTYHVKIDDPAEANFQEKQETRVLENAQGFYSVLEPNGALRTVTYTADERGFNPVVSYTYGHPVAPVKKVVKQPVIQVAQVAPVAVAPAPIRVQQVVARPVVARPVVARPALVAAPAPVAFAPAQTVAVAAPVKQTVAVSGGYSYPVPAKVVSTPVQQTVVASGGYSYPVPANPLVLPAGNYLPPAPAKVVAAPVKAYLPPKVAVAAAPVLATQSYVSAPAAVVAPVRKAVVAQQGGYSYGISSADHYGLAYGSPTFSYHATRTYSHPPAVVQKVAQPVVQKVVAQPQLVQRVVAQAPVQVAAPIRYAPAQVQVAAPVRYATPVQYAAPQIQYAAPQVQYAPAPVRAIQTIQPAQYAIPQQIAYAQPQAIPQIAYGAPQVGPSISYAPQHISYAPAPVVKQVQLAQPQISLANIAQAQVSYVAQQPTIQFQAAPVQQVVQHQQLVQSYPAPAPVAVAAAPVKVAAAPVLKQQVVSGNGLQISGNAFAVPAASGAKNPLTFEYTYGDGASKVSHSYSGSGW